MSINNCPTETSSAPPELDPYWPDRIAHDRTWYGKYVSLNNFFYSPHSDSVYSITAVSNDGDVFSLDTCTTASVKQASSTSLSDFSATQTTSAWLPDNVCALAGSLEAGDLVHLDKGTIKTIGERSFFTLDAITLEFPRSEVDSDALHQTLQRPHSPEISDIVSLSQTTDQEITLHIPQTVSTQSTTEKQTSVQKTSDQEKSTPSTRCPQDSASSPHPVSEYTQDVKTRFIPVEPFSKWTFESPAIREWVEGHFEDGDTILNVCAGKTTLTPPPGGTIIRNDINPEREADYTVDVAELAAQDGLEKHSISKIIFDPPWSIYQVTLRYDDYGQNIVSNDHSSEISLNKLPFETPTSDEKTQVGHARLAKLGFDWLLEPGGEVLELTHHGTSMFPSYQRMERVIFDPVGEAKAVIGSRDKKIQKPLTTL
jgi:hypothetical protein